MEIGKRDVYGNTRLGQYPFRRNLTFHYLDLALMAASQPLHRRVLQIDYAVGQLPGGLEWLGV